MKIKVLILDDDLVDQKLIIRALKNSRFEVEYTTFENPSDFFNNCNCKDYNVFFIDYMLPVMNGVEVIKKIRDLGCKETIILNTTVEDDNLIESAIEAGATNYMTKDLINPSALTSIIKSSFSINNSKNEFDNLLQRQVSIIEGTNIGTFEYDISTGNAIINDRWCEIVGYTREELEPISINSWINLVHPEDLRISKKKLTQCLKKEIEYYDFKFRMKHKNGSWIWAHDKGKIIKWDGAIAKKMYGTHADITFQKQFEHDLIEAKKDLERAMQAKDVFLANMSHEIRTPMNAIIGFTEILSKFDYSTEQREYLDAVRFSGENLLALINDVLDLSKIESGKLDLEREPFSLTDTVGNAFKLMEIRALQKNISLKLNLDSSIPTDLIGDSTRLNQILINLVGNAIKFTEKGQVEIKLKLKKRTEKSVELLISVEDTGIGIEKDKLERIFERFTQAESNTTRNYGGTGLGLNICRHLIELHNSELKVKSEVGKGSEFSFEINYPISELELENKNKDQLHLKFEPNSKNILVFEDNVLNQKLIFKVLKDFGFENIKIVNDGSEGIAFLEKNHMDLLLMDIQMPIMTGYEATKVIRETMRCQVPILAMTAQAFKEEREKCLELGMNDYISKPFKQIDLFNKIANLLHLKSEKNSDGLSIETNNELPTLDLSQLYELSDGDKEFEVDILNTFVEQANEELEFFNKNVDEVNIDYLKKISHKMKSSIQLFENKEVTEALNEIEFGNYQIENIQKEINVVQIYFKDKINSIKQYLQNNT